MTDRPGDLAKAPPDPTGSSPAPVRFVDFEEVTHRLEIDFASQHAEVETSISFQLAERGAPLFDWVNPERAITAATLDGENVRPKLRSHLMPGQLLAVKCIGIPVEPGRHTLVLRGQVPNLRFADPARPRLDLNSRWTDGIEGRYLEWNLPSNFPFDQYSLCIELQVQGLADELAVFANGAVSPTASGAIVRFPRWYTTCCPSLHFGSAGAFTVAPTRQLDGRLVTTFGIGATGVGELEVLRDRAIDEIVRQSSWWGSLPEGDILIQKSGGTDAMEFALSVKSGAGTLAHEVSHLFFARCVLPADGDAGWIDEAIASAVEANFATTGVPEPESKNIGRRSPYERATASAAKVHGWRFLAHIDRLIGGGTGSTRLIELLASYFAEYKGRVVRAPDFQKRVKDFTGRDFSEEFERFVYGKGSL